MQIKQLFLSFALILLGVLVSQGCSGISSKSGIADHEVASLAMLESLSDSEINNAKLKLVIVYGHTSHGSQITDGVNGLIAFM